MGLDMYLNRMPRYKNTTVHEVSAIEAYFDWQKAKAEGSKYADCTLEKWCGVDESELPNKDIIDYYKEHKYGYGRIIEQVGYWRKANQIHNWFVEHVQDGEDDCAYHHECTREVLEELLDTCKTVLDSCAMTYGKVNNGYRGTPNGWEPIYEDGKIIIDSSVAEELLPSCSGFFFGGTEYDEYYVNDIVETIKILEEVLATTDFETQAIYYVSSW
ncbi:MAG: hypothetical protein PUE12_18570 [Oscillospiraceae bacterium]|nr:hypothetical protein [Oscillospiraceae bacterium]